MTFNEANKKKQKHILLSFYFFQPSFFYGCIDIHRARIQIQSLGPSNISGDADQRDAGSPA